MLIFTETKICNLPHPHLPQPLSETTNEHLWRVPPPLGYSPLLLYDAVFHFVTSYMTGLLTLAQDGG